MAIPRSELLAKRLHEAGVIGDPFRVTKVEIIAEAGKPIRVVTSSMIDEHQMEVIVRELGGEP